MDYGAIIRNSKLEVIVAWSKKFSGLFSPSAIEPKPLGLSLSWARDISLPLCSVESDALLAVNHLNWKNFPCSVYGDLLKDVSHLLSYFLDVVVNHVYHFANKSIHGLTHFALGLDDECI